MFHAVFVSRFAVAALALSMAGSALAGVVGHAGRVVSYDPGADQFQFSSYDNPEAALGVSPTDTGWGFLVTPFNSPWSPSDIVSIGLGGHLTLELSHYALPQLDSLELGVFTFQQFLQNSANGGTYSDARLFYPSNQAIVEVSADGQNWISLNDGNLLAFDIPAAAFQDVANTIPADYHKPFAGTRDDLADLSFNDLLATYDGSAGGTWLDLSDTGLDQIGFLRFSVPESAAFSFQLEGISLAAGAIGAAVPEPASLALLGLGALVMLRRRRA